MAITEVGTRSVATVTAAEGAQATNNVSHTTTSDTDLLLAFVGVEGNEVVTATTGCQYDAVNMTLIRDTGLTGSNSDIRVYVYGMISPGANTANARTAFDGGGASPAISIWVNINGVNTDSVAAATNYISEDVNTDAGTSSVLSSGGSSGNGLMAWGVAQHENNSPSSIDSGFSEILDSQTAATSEDVAYLLSSHFAGAPSGATITWPNSNEQSAVLIELVAASANTGSNLRQRIYAA